VKIGRNLPCPCGSGEKYKSCCEGKKDWGKLSMSGDFPRHLTLRGKNLYFLHGAASILGINPLREKINWPDLKKRITPEHVGRIYELVKMVWPSASDLKRALEAEREDLSGIYIGDYTPEDIIQNITRHALYSDSIYIFDPLTYPGSLRPEFDPITYPEKHVSQTIKCLFIWLSLAPLIESGILRIIRSPADFDHAMRWDSLITEQQRFAQHPELDKLKKKVAEETVAAKSGETGWMTEWAILSYPDEAIIEMLEENGHEQEEIARYLIYRKTLKDSHPYYTDRRSSELIQATIGECHCMARHVAEMSGSFLLTDNPVRWKVIEIERMDAQVNDSVWEPFAATMQNAPLKYLNGVSLENCLKLRDDGLLLRMRSFLRLVWARSRIGEDFSRATAEQFSAELGEEVAAAETEWKSIDKKLTTWFAAEAAAALAAVPTIEIASSGWLAASLGVAGMANLADAHMRRKGLIQKMPGAFFLEPKKARRGMTSAKKS